MKSDHINLIKFAERLNNIQDATQKLFIGRYQSLSQSVILWLAINYLGKDQTPLKNAHLSLPYSERAIRLFLKNLEQDGWIKISINPNDKRYKNLQLTNKFIDSFKKYYQTHMKYMSDLINQDRN